MITAAAVCGAAQQQAPAPIGELYAGDGQARLMQPVGSGMSVVAGSELSAGIATARLKLYRGGQVALCPRSSVTVNSGRLGLMFAMSRGSLVFDYPLLQSGSDFLITPDFRIQLPGPGKYHFAVGANEHGDTCVKTLPGNTGPIDFSELMSSATFRVRPQDSMLFHGGKLNGNTPLAAAETCGCPEPPPVMQAAASPQTAALPQPQVTPGTIPVNKKEVTEPLPADHPGQVHVEVDTPFVYSGRNTGEIQPYSVAKIRLSSLPNLYFVQERVDPVVLPEKPAAVSISEARPAQVAPEQNPVPAKKHRRGFFGKLKRIITGMFHR